MESSLIGLAVLIGAGTLTAIVGIVFGSIVSIRKEGHKHEAAKLSHAERLRAIELGQPLPDAEIARASAEASRAWAAGTIGTLVPAMALGAAAGISSLILGEQYPANSHGIDPHQQLFLIIWIVAGVVSVAAILGSVRALRRTAPARAAPEAPPVPAPPAEDPATGNARTPYPELATKEGS